jgi:tetratricopeptide (TPR) repeat protein
LRTAALAIEYHNKSERDGAIADDTEAIRLDPIYSRAVYSRGNAYLDKEEYDNAIADYTEAIRLNPDDAKAYNNRASAYSGKGDHHRAMADYSQSIRLNPNKSCEMCSARSARDPDRTCGQALPPRSLSAPS